MAQPASVRISASVLREISRPPPHLLSERARAASGPGSDAELLSAVRRLVHQAPTSGLEPVVLETTNAALAPARDASPDPMRLNLSGAGEVVAEAGYSGDEEERAGAESAGDAVASYLRKTMSLLHARL